MKKATVMSILLLLSGFAQAEWIPESPQAISNTISQVGNYSTAVVFTTVGGFPEAYIVLAGGSCPVKDKDKQYISVDGKYYVWESYCYDDKTVMHFAGAKLSQELIAKFKGRKEVTFKLNRYEFSADTNGFNAAFDMLR